ncbi:MAG: iron-containing alcohol dehydrogenase [Lachnospiraceae bacterium]|nr:iron-containing alcohol dehydrogenase [Lachnospiraceae bacterium]
MTSRQDEEGIVCKTKIDVCVGTGFGYSCKGDKYDPTYLYTLPSKQTAAGAVDILSHVMEQYFQPNDEAYITDVLSEAVMKTVIKYARKTMDELCIIGHDGTPSCKICKRSIWRRRG